MIAGVSIDEEEWLHFRHTSDDAANSDEFAQVDTSDIPYSHCNIGEKRPEVQIAA